MLLTDRWKQDMYKTIQMVCDNKINPDVLKKKLDGYVNKSLSQGVRRGEFRNIYKNEYFSCDLNDIMNIVEENHLIIGANGSYTYSPFDVLGDTSIMIIDDLDGRAKEKALAKDFEKRNMLKEANLHDVLQTKRKQDTNSTYGIACQPGSFLFNPDAASYITSQSRQLISEMLWSFERLLANNLQLLTYNEALLYCKKVLERERHFDKFKHYISYIPSKKGMQKYLLSKFSYIKEFHEKTMKFSKLLFLFIDSLSEEDRCYLFYAFNLPALLKCNPKVMRIFKDVLDGTEEFLNPNKIPDCYKPLCDEFIGVTEEFCYQEFMTTNRVDKYFDSDRHVILLSDTDSVFIILSPLMNAIYERTSLSYKNTENDFKLVNTLCAMNTHYIGMRHDRFVEVCNVKYRFPDYKLNAKNEFYYKRIILYTGVKKNYSGLKLLREGNRVPPKKQISHTGIKLIASKIPKQVSDFQTSLIENEILRADVINPISIAKKMQAEKETIIQLIKSGDKSLGIPNRFSGKNKYANYKSTMICRLVEIWDRLYPDQKVGAGEYLMCFETKVYNESQLYMIKDEEMREKIREVVFSERYKGEDNFLRQHGLKTVGVPKDGDTYKIPEWMLDIIDYDIMARKHLQSMSDLYPSLNMNKAKMPGGKGSFSSLLSF